MQQPGVQEPTSSLRFILLRLRVTVTIRITTVITVSMWHCAGQDREATDQDHAGQRHARKPSRLLSSPSGAWCTTRQMSSGPRDRDDDRGCPRIRRAPGRRQGSRHAIHRLALIPPSEPRPFPFQRDSSIPRQPREPHPPRLHHVQSIRTGLTWRLCAIRKVWGTIAPTSLHVAQIHHTIRHSLTTGTCRHTWWHGERVCPRTLRYRRTAGSRTMSSRPA
jgi:hypothetical protein